MTIHEDETDEVKQKSPVTRESIIKAGETRIK